MKSNRIVVLCLVASSAWARQGQDYIIGGQNVGAGDPVASSTVALYEPSADGHSGSLCSATLLKKDIAVTAAHCFQPGAQRPVVLFGPDLHAATTAHRPVEQVSIHPDWSGHSAGGMDQGDIALVKFPGGLPAGFHQAPTIASDSEVKAGSKTILAGYGISNAQTKTGAGRLRKTTVSVLDARPGKSEMILDQSHGRGACHGDSGGPAYIRRGGKTILAGLTNRGFPNDAPDDCGHRVVYTKIPAYKSWIQKSEKQMEASRSSNVLAPPMPERPMLMAKKGSAINFSRGLANKGRFVAKRSPKKDMPKRLAKRRPNQDASKRVAKAARVKVTRVAHRSRIGKKKSLRA